MRNITPIRVSTLLLLVALLCCIAAAAPKVGDAALEFSLETLTGEKVTLSDAAAQGPVVLVVLRGYPGYQCPICTRQVGELLENADAFAKAGATVVLVYPGAAKDLDQQAAEFIKGKDFPAHFRFVTDPAYDLTNAWGLRWDEPQETAYPSSFVIGQDKIITYAKISQSHDGRPATSELIEAVTRTKAATDAAAKDKAEDATR